MFTTDLNVVGRAGRLANSTSLLPSENRLYNSKFLQEAVYAIRILSEYGLRRSNSFGKLFNLTLQNSELASFLQV
jgi:hypothetical protein